MEFMYGDDRLEPKKINRELCMFRCFEHIAESQVAGNFLVCHSSIDIIYADELANKFISHPLAVSSITKTIMCSAKGILI